MCNTLCSAVVLDLEHESLFTFVTFSGNFKVLHCLFGFFVFNVDKKRQLQEMEGRIWQCRAGHLLCEPCKDRPEVPPADNIFLSDN